MSPLEHHEKLLYTSEMTVLSADSIIGLCSFENDHGYFRHHHVRSLRRHVETIFEPYLEEREDSQHFHFNKTP